MRLDILAAREDYRRASADNIAPAADGEVATGSCRLSGRSGAVRGRGPGVASCVRGARTDAVKPAPARKIGGFGRRDCPPRSVAGARLL